MDALNSGAVVIGLGLMFGVSVGVGLALGLEIIMRLAGDGRTVILTWARTKHEPE